MEPMPTRAVASPPHLSPPRPSPARPRAAARPTATLAPGRLLLPLLALGLFGCGLRGSSAELPADLERRTVCYVADGRLATTEAALDFERKQVYLVHDGELHRVELGAFLPVVRDGEYLSVERAEDFLTDVGGPYAATQAWFAGGDTIRVLGQRMVKFGFPRIIGPTEAEPVATYDGVPILGDPHSTTHDVVWVPVGMFCYVQPYQAI